MYTHILYTHMHYIHTHYIYKHILHTHISIAGLYFFSKGKASFVFVNGSSGSKLKARLFQRKPHLMQADIIKVQKVKETFHSD